MTFLTKDDFYSTFMALSLLAKLLMIERDSWKRELPVSATSEISWLTAMMIWAEEGGEKRHQKSKRNIQTYTFPK